MNKKLTIAILVLLCGIPICSSAQETVEDASCQAECPEGQVKISFADGAKVACVCSEESTGMVETPEVADDGCLDADDNGSCDEES